MTEQELVEQLASCEHSSWVRWMNYLFSKCKQVPFEGTNNANLLAQRDLIIPAAYVEALQKQIDTPYAELSEQEKRYDRDEVAHILPIIEAYKAAQSGSLLDQAALAEAIARMDRQIRRLSAEVFATRITEQLDKIDDTRRTRQTLLGRVDELSHMVALGDVDQSFFVE